MINEITITRLKDQKFNVPGGYALCSGYVLKYQNGFVAFHCDNGLPYLPRGGRKALQAILDAGGFINFDNMCFVNPMT